MLAHGGLLVGEGRERLFLSFELLHCHYQRQRIYRPGELCPAQGGGILPRAEWYEQYFWEDNVAVDSVGMLIVHTYLKPDKGNNNPEEYGLHLYIKDFRWDEPVEGQEYAFTAIALEETYVPLDTLVNRVYRENISLALFDVGWHRDNPLCAGKRYHPLQPSRGCREQ